MKKKIIIIFLTLFLTILILGVIIVSAGTTNKKEYDKNLKKLKIKDKDNNLLIEQQRLTAQNNYVVDRGDGIKQLVARYIYIDFDETKSGIFTKNKFYDFSKNMKKIHRDFDWRYAIQIPIVIPNYIDNCGKQLINKTLKNICTRIQNGTKIIYKEEWIPFTQLYQLPNKNISVGLFVDIKPREHIEYIPTFFGIDVKEDAEWTESLNTDLFAYYAFENLTGEGYIESVDRVNNLVISDGVPYFNASLQGEAIVFDSSKDVNISNSNNSESFGFVSSSYSLNVWINFTSSFGGLRWFLDKYEDNTHGWRMFILLGGEVRISGMSAIDLDGNVVSSGGDGWNMVTVTKNSTHSCLFQEGSLVVCQVNNTVGLSSKYVKVGDATSGSGSNWDGAIDELGFWNRTLTPSEITDLYNSGTPLTYKSVGVINTSTTIPTTPLLTNETFINITASDLSLNKIIGAYFTVYYPDNNTILNNVNGTWISGDASSGETEEWHSHLFNITENSSSLGTWNWSVIVSRNTSGSASNVSADGSFNISDLDFPQISIDFPTENLNISQNTTIDLNFSTLSDNLGLDTCWFSIDAGNTNTTLASCANTSFGLVNNTYNFTTWVNDSSGNLNSSTIENLTIIFDVTPPNVTIISPSAAETTRSPDISLDIFDAGTVSDCEYNVSLQTTPFTVQILTTNITNCANTTMTTLSLDGSFTITFFVNDTTGNINISEKNFSVDTSGTPSTPSGGGGAIPIVVVGGPLGWTMESESGSGSYQFNMVQNGKRTKSLIFKNNGDESRTITLSCQDVSKDKNLCQHVTFENDTFVLPLLLDVSTSIDFIVEIPEDFEKGDYFINLVAIDDLNRQGILTAEINLETFGFIQKIGTKIFSTTKIGGLTIPYILFFFVTFLFIGAGSFIITRQTKIKGTIPISLVVGAVGGFAILLIL